MPASSSFTPEMNQYFDTLPAYIQENIKQSNQNFNSLEDLRSVAEKLMEKSK